MSDTNAAQTGSTEVGTSARKFTVETLTWGKNISRDAAGAVQRNAGYQIKLASPSLLAKSKYYTNNLTPIELKPKHIDPEFKKRGALMLRTVDEGLLVTRFRFCRDGGEGSKTSRSFLLGRSVLLEDSRNARNTIFEFLAWCVNDYRAEPFYEDSPDEVPPLTISMPRTAPADLSSCFWKLIEYYTEDVSLCVESLNRFPIADRSVSAPLPQNTDPRNNTNLTTQELENIVLNSLFLANAIIVDADINREYDATNISVSIGLSPITKAADLMFSSQSVSTNGFQVDRATTRKVSDYKATLAAPKKTEAPEPQAYVARDTTGRVIGVECITLKD